MTRLEADWAVRWLSVGDLAGMLQVPIKTVYDWQYRREGPRPIRVGRYLRYDPEDVGRWLKAKKDAS